jgi:hypothetical protein
MPERTVPVTRKAIRLPDVRPIPERVQGLLDPPMEISRARLRGLNMVDETIIVRKSLRQKDGR